MEHFRHVTVLNVDLSRKFFTGQGLHMNNLGKERIAIEIGNAVTTVLQKNRIGMSVSDVSYKNFAITQEKLLDEVNGTVENETVSELGKRCRYLQEFNI